MVFWNENLVPHESQHRWWESDLGQASILDQSRKRKKVHATRKHPLVPTAIYLECLWHTLLCICVHLYIPARCILLSAVPQVPQVFVLYVGVCFIFGMCTEKNPWRRRRREGKKKVLRGSEWLDLPWMLLIGRQFLSETACMCLCLHVSSHILSWSVCSESVRISRLFFAPSFSSQTSGKDQSHNSNPDSSHNNNKKCWY